MSGGGNFEAEVKNSLRQIRASVDGLNRSQQQTQASAKGLGKQLRDAYKEGGVGAVFAKAKAVELDKQLGKVGQAAARLKGPLGEILGNITGGIGMGGGLGKLALAAAAAGVAFKSYGMVVEEVLERSRALAEMNNRVADSMKSIADRQRDLTKEGLGRAGARRKLRGAGGQQAVDQVEEVLDQMPELSRDEVESGVAAVYGRYGAGHRAAAAVRAAVDVARVGGSFGQAAGTFAEQGGAYESPGAGRRATAMEFQRQTGRVGAPLKVLEQAEAAVGVDDPLLRKARDEAGVRVTRDREVTARAPSGDSGARADLAETRNPGAAAALALANAVQQQTAIMQAQLAALEKLTEGKSFLSHPISWTTGWFTKNVKGWNLARDIAAQNDALRTAADQLLTEGN